VNQWTWLAHLSDRQCLILGRYFLTNPFQLAVHQSSCAVSAGSYFIWPMWLVTACLAWSLADLLKPIMLWRDCYVCCREVSFQLQWKIPLQHCVILYSVYGECCTYKVQDIFINSGKSWKRFWATGSTVHSKRNCRRYMLTEKKLDEIGASVQENNCSTCVAMGLSASLAHFATKTAACASI